MPMTIVFSCFIFFYIFAVALSLRVPLSKQKPYFVMACVVLALLAGFRSFDWYDTTVYTTGFAGGAKSLFEWSYSLEPWGYGEKGFFFLGFIVKTFTDDPVIYLLFISLLTFYFIYKAGMMYCIFPLIGLCDYIARFLFNRNFIQIRSALAIAIVMYSLQYVHQRKLLKFLTVVGVAYLFHQSTLIVLPFFLLAYIRLKKKHIIIGLILCWIAAFVLAPYIATYVEDWSTDLNYETYVTTGYVESALGLANPMIYFQMLILLFFTFREKKIVSQNQYYYTFRDAYFYSTCILILFCNYSALSGRTSTLLATVEMMILPLIGLSFTKHARILYFVVLGIILSFIFYLKCIEFQRILD